MEQNGQALLPQGQRERASGIELLKIIAIFIIVLSHFIQTLGGTGGGYKLNIFHVTDDVQILALAILRFGGGNSIFFVCSAWFLLDKKRCSPKKLLEMVLEVWTVSVLILAAVLLFGKIRLPKQTILRCLLPTIFSNNWYIDCYLIFSLTFPFLNRLLDIMDQRQLLTASVVMLILYFIGFVFTGLASPFYINDLVSWIMIYFWIAYLKRYLPRYASSTRFGLILFGIGLIGQIATILLTNQIGQHIPYFENELQRWNVKTNLFVWMRAIGLLLIARNLKFSSKFINGVSGLSMLAYVIHENILLRSYYRPMLYEWLHSTFGYEHILWWVLLFAFAVCVASLIVSFLFKISVEKLIRRICGRIYPALAEKCNKIITALEKI